MLGSQDACCAPAVQHGHLQVEEYHTHLPGASAGRLQQRVGRVGRRQRRLVHVSCGCVQGVKYGLIQACALMPAITMSRLEH